MSEEQDDRLFGIPRIIVPLGNIDGGGGEQALPQRTFGEEPEIISDPEQSGNIPYVMRSTLLGSDDPTNPAAALGLGVANTDTWKREDPPQKQTVAISNASVATATVLTTAAHGIAAGITTTVKIAGVSTTTPPIPDAFYQATYVSATSVSIPFTVTVGGIDSVLHRRKRGRHIYSEGIHSAGEEGRIRQDLLHQRRDSGRD